MLHTFIPHTHVEEGSNHTELSCDDNDRCVLELLAVILEHDFGEDHLERFQVSENQFHDISIDIFYELSLSKDDLKITQSTHKLPDYLDPVPDDPDINLCYYRGPPLYSISA